MNPVVLAIWWIMLIATVVVIIPTLVRLLLRALNAGRRIEQYTAEILASAGAVVENTASVASLKVTLSAAQPLLAGAESIERHTATIEAALAARLPENGKVDRKEV
jgi:hypothetical protein